MQVEWKCPHCGRTIRPRIVPTYVTNESKAPPNDGVCPHDGHRLVQDQRVKGHACVDIGEEPQC